MVLLGLQAIAGWLAHRNYLRLPDLHGPPLSDAGHVSIVIPARDEVARLPVLLTSLRNLRYADIDVLVVDDASSDGTGEVATALGARTIRVPGPEPGWTGKSFACWVGAEATQGEWILFTDADTEHGPDSLGLALKLARDREAGLCSLLARQRCQTFWERLFLPYAYFLYFVGAWAINEPGGAAIANGQYMLFRRAAYERLGGHAAVQGSIIEDVSLGRLAQEKDVPVVLARGEAHLQVRMYSDLSALWEGFGKNAFRFVRVSPRTGALTVGASIAFASALPIAARARSPFLRCSLMLLPALVLSPWNRRFGVGLSIALVWPLAAAGFLPLALDSMRRAMTRRGTVWKGRHY